MKINPHATVVPFLVMVDPEQCEDVDDFDIANQENYNTLLLVDHIQLKQGGN
jgi:hypothetical protein